MIPPRQSRTQNQVMTALKWSSFSFAFLGGLCAGEIWAVDLHATRAGENVVMSWSQAGSESYYLEVSTNLNDPSGWSIDTNSIANAGGDCSATMPIGGPSRFYRLQAWEVLFDGTSTSAFRGYRQSGFPSSSWTITSNGELQTVAGSAQGYIITTNLYADFELLWEWKTAAGGNGGVLYRVTEYYDQAHKSGPEYQLIDDPYYAIPANQLLGAVYGLIAPTNRVTVATGQWNQCRLLVQGNHVEHWLNGRRVAQYELNSASFNALVAASAFSAYSQFAKAPTGYIAFQNWTPEIWYRNIKVRRLPAQ